MFNVWPGLWFSVSPGSSVSALHSWTGTKGIRWPGQTWGGDQMFGPTCSAFTPTKHTFFFSFWWSWPTGQVGVLIPAWCLPPPAKSPESQDHDRKGAKMQLQPIVTLKGRPTDLRLPRRWDTYFHNEGHLGVSRAQEGLSIGPFMRRRGGN